MSSMVHVHSLKPKYVNVYMYIHISIGDYVIGHGCMSKLSQGIPNRLG